MKRNIAIASIAALALAAGGTTAALAVGGGDDGSSTAGAKSSVRVQDDDRRGAAPRDDDADDRYEDRHDDGQDDRYDDGEDAREDARDAKAAKVSAAEAIAAALKSTSGTAVSADLDDEDGGLVWDVDVLGEDGRTWYSVEIDPGTGKVLGSHTERDDEDAAEARGALKGASVSASEAARAAADKGSVTSVELDDDSHRAGGGAWDVETVSRDGAEGHWSVDPRSGKVTVSLDD
ncbi:PepSY domain-containing protein [Streptomyces sp. G45]|uniref:PepSY domain-containing protein n=1 Tax=Streptomyces sp. G45 TaxID=3406627 RepID=UPI003C292E7C